MPQTSTYTLALPKTKTFELDGCTWATDESTFKVLERQASAGTELIASWYFAFCVGAGTVVRLSIAKTGN